MSLATDLIFDLGFHAGQDTEFYLKKGFRVVAVEANPELVAAGRRRFRDALKKGRLTIVDMGVARNAAEMTFYVNGKNSAWSSFVREIGSRGGEFQTVKVRTTTLRELLDRYGTPHYLKIDVEGFDEIVVEALADVQKRPQFVSIENGYPRSVNLFLSLGYDRFKYVNQADVAAQRLPFPPREGRFAFHRFSYESSGAFGEEAPGEWLSGDDVLREIEAYWATPDLDAAVHGWRDLHAKFAE